MIQDKINKTFNHTAIVVDHIRVADYSILSLNTLILLTK